MINTPFIQYLLVLTFGSLTNPLMSSLDSHPITNEPDSIITTSSTFYQPNSVKKLIVIEPVGR